MSEVQTLNIPLTSSPQKTSEKPSRNNSLSIPNNKLDLKAQECMIQDNHLNGVNNNIHQVTTARNSPSRSFSQQIHIHIDDAPSINLANNNNPNSNKSKNSPETELVTIEKTNNDNAALNNTSTSIPIPPPSTTFSSSTIPPNNSKLSIQPSSVSSLLLASMVSGSGSGSSSQNNSEHNLNNLTNTPNPLGVHSNTNNNNNNNNGSAGVSPSHKTSMFSPSSSSSPKYLTFEQNGRSSLHTSNSHKSKLNNNNNYHSNPNQSSANTTKSNRVKVTNSNDKNNNNNNNNNGNKRDKDGERASRRSSFDNANLNGNSNGPGSPPNPDTMSPFTLFFLSKENEANYRTTSFTDSAAALATYRALPSVVLSLLFVCGLFPPVFRLITLSCDILGYPANDDSCNRQRNALIVEVCLLASGASGLSILYAITSLSRASLTQTRHSSALLSTLLAISGILWSIGSVIGRDKLLPDTFSSISKVIYTDNNFYALIGSVTTLNSLPCIAFLVISHLVGHFLLFAFLFISSWLVVISYSVAALSTRLDGEDWSILVLTVAFVWLVNITLCHASHSIEIQKRKSFIKEKQLRENEVKYKLEAYDLRAEVWEMTLQNLGIGAPSSSIDLTSPIQKSMGLLHELQRDKNLSKDNFLRVKQIIDYLASSSDIYKPKVEQVVDDLKQAHVDENTTGWLLGLVNGDYVVNRSANDVPSTHRELSTSLTSPTIGSFTTTSIPPPLDSSEEKILDEITNTIDDWNFDLFKVQKFTMNRPLFFIGLMLFRKFNLISKFNIHLTTLSNFLTAVEKGYQQKKYHNSLHAADVTRTVQFFFARGGLKNYLTDLEILAGIIASAVHDYDHPGVGNSFLIRTRDPLAILYNDRSVLENHHCSSAYKLLLSPATNILAHLQPREWDECRRIVVDMVLATDLTQHFEFMNLWKTQVAKTPDKSSEAFKLMTLKMALKCADVGHAAKTIEVHKLWTHRIVEEFYEQGDLERQRKFPISPFMDRKTANVASAQIGFIDFLVMPMYKQWTEFLFQDGLDEDAIPCVQELANNRAYWEGRKGMTQNQNTNDNDKDKDKDKDKTTSNTNDNNKNNPSPNSQANPTNPNANASSNTNTQTDTTKSAPSGSNT